MTNELHLSLAKNIKSFREARSFTQDELSDRAGVAYSTVAKLEQGAIKNPTLLTVASIAGALEVSIDDLVEVNLHQPREESNQAPIKFVYFDMNGVLVRFFHRAFTAISRETNTSVDKVESIFWHYNAAANRGDISAEQFDKYLGEALSLKDFSWEKFYMKAAQPLKSVHAYLENLQDRVDIGILSNTFPGFISKMTKTGLIPDINYKVIVDSSEVGSVKPESKIYEVAEKMAKAKGEEIFFIDDSRENLMAAERRGWRVLWFDDFHPEESLKRIQEILDL